MTPADLDAIRARLAAATPGPWEYLGQGYIVHPGSTYDGCGVPNRSTRIPLCDADADLIAHAPEDLRALVAENERLRALIETGEPAATSRKIGVQFIGGPWDGQNPDVYHVTAPVFAPGHRIGNHYWLDTKSDPPAYHWDGTEYETEGATR